MKRRHLRRRSGLARDRRRDRGPHQRQIKALGERTVKQSFNTNDIGAQDPRCIEWVTSIHTLERATCWHGTKSRAERFQDGTGSRWRRKGSVGCTSTFAMPEAHVGRETRLDRQQKSQEGTTPQLSGKHAPPRRRLSAAWSEPAIPNEGRRSAYLRSVFYRAELAAARNVDIARLRATPDVSETQRLTLVRWVGDVLLLDRVCCFNKNTVTSIRSAPRVCARNSQTAEESAGMHSCSRLV